MYKKGNVEEQSCKERRWVKIQNTYEEEGFRRIEAWKTGDDSKEGQVIAAVDMLSGRVFYNDAMARVDEYAQKIIQKTVQEAKTKHPYGIERLEELLWCIVDWESEEGLEKGFENLENYGFTDGEMEFFDFPFELNWSQLQERLKKRFRIAEKRKSA